MTVPCPSSSLRRRTTVGASSFSWVAQAVEPARTTSRPSANDSGVQCAATSSPTSSGQRANTPAIRRSSAQPWSATIRPTVVSRVCGSRSSGWAPEARLRGRPLRRRRRTASGTARADPPSRRRGPSRGPGRARRRRCSGSGRARARAPGRGAPRQPSSVLRTSPSATAYRTPASCRRHVGADRGRDQHLLGVGDQRRELCAPFGVELGEHVVQDQDRVVAVGAQQVVRREPQRERERPATRRGRRSP